jgi:hypothetical protein
LRALLPSSAALTLQRTKFRVSSLRQVALVGRTSTCCSLLRKFQLCKSPRILLCANLSKHRLALELWVLGDIGALWSANTVGVCIRTLRRNVTLNTIKANLARRCYAALVTRAVDAGANVVVRRSNTALPA